MEIIGYQQKVTECFELIFWRTGRLDCLLWSGFDEARKERNSFIIYGFLRNHVTPIKDRDFR